jgi:cytochrome c biogenesis protein ResB
MKVYWDKKLELYAKFQPHSMNLWGNLWTPSIWMQWWFWMIILIIIIIAAGSMCLLGRALNSDIDGKTEIQQ